MRKEYDLSGGKRGAVLPARGKTCITIMLDDDILEAYREKALAGGTGYQTMINAALRESLTGAEARRKEDRPVTLRELRKVLREELRTQ